MALTIIFSALPLLLKIFKQLLNAYPFNEAINSSLSVIETKYAGFITLFELIMLIVHLAHNIQF